MEDNMKRTDETAPDSWVSIKEAAAHLDVSTAFLRKAVRLRKIPFARLGTKALRFRKVDLDAWARSNGSGEITHPQSKSR